MLGYCRQSITKNMDKYVNKVLGGLPKAKKTKYRKWIHC